MSPSLPKSETYATYRNLHFATTYYLRLTNVQFVYNMHTTDETRVRSVEGIFGRLCRRKLNEFSENRFLISQKSLFRDVT